MDDSNWIITKPKKNWMLSNEVIKRLELNPYEVQMEYMVYILQGEDGKDYELNHIILQFFKKAEELLK